MSAAGSRALHPGRARRLGCALAVLASLGASAPVRADEAGLTAHPTRIVSLSPCLDAILLELVPPERIAALSHYSRGDHLGIAARAARLPVTYETAEEVVALRPDLVLMSRHSAVPTRNALRRVGIRFELFDIAFSIAQSLAQIRRVAALTGREREGAALVQRIERAIAAARPTPHTPRRSAAVYEPGGLTAGAGTVTDELMQIAGLENIAARHGVREHQPLPLELLLSTPPDLLLTDAVPAAEPTQSVRIVRHRALRALPSVRHDFPPRFMYCAGPTIIEAAAALVAARDSVRPGLQAERTR